jgi:hypothetical protein
MAKGDGVFKSAFGDMSEIQVRIVQTVSANLTAERPDRFRWGIVESPNPSLTAALQLEQIGLIKGGFYGTIENRGNHALVYSGEQPR